MVKNRRTLRHTFYTVLADLQGGTVAGSAHARHGLLHELSRRRRSRQGRQLEEALALNQGDHDVDHQLAAQVAARDLQEAGQRGGRQGQYDAIRAADRVQVLETVRHGARHRRPDAAGGIVGP